MIISHKFQFIFIRTPKTAGTSVEITLSRYCGPKDVVTPLGPEEEYVRRDLAIYPRHYARWPFGLLVGDRINLHRYPVRTGKVLAALGARRFTPFMTARAIRDRVRPDIWNSYTKFAIEREPLDRLMSRYYSDLTADRVRTIDEFMARPALESTFEHYSIDGDVAVDRVLRFDRLKEDLQELCADIGLSFDGWLPRARANNRRNKRNWRDLLDTDHIERVRAECAREYRVLQDLGAPLPGEVLPLPAHAPVPEHPRVAPITADSDWQSDGTQDYAPDYADVPNAPIAAERPEPVAEPEVPEATDPREPEPRHFDSVPDAGPIVVGAPDPDRRGVSPLSASLLDDEDGPGETPLRPRGHREEPETESRPWHHPEPAAAPISFDESEDAELSDAPTVASAAEKKPSDPLADVLAEIRAGLAREEAEGPSDDAGSTATDTAAATPEEASQVGAAGPVSAGETAATLPVVAGARSVSRVGPEESDGPVDVEAVEVDDTTAAGDAVEVDAVPMEAEDESRPEPDEALDPAALLASIRSIQAARAYEVPPAAPDAPDATAPVAPHADAGNAKETEVETAVAAAGRSDAEQPQASPDGQPAPTGETARPDVNEAPAEDQAGAPPRQADRRRGLTSDPAFHARLKAEIEKSLRGALSEALVARRIAKALETRRQALGEEGEEISDAPEAASEGQASSRNDSANSESPAPVSSQDDSPAAPREVAPTAPAAGEPAPAPSPEKEPVSAVNAADMDRPAEPAREPRPPPVELVARPVPSPDPEPMPAPSEAAEPAAATVAADALDPPPVPAWLDDEDLSWLPGHGEGEGVTAGDTTTATSSSAMGTAGPATDDGSRISNRP